MLGTVCHQQASPNLTGEMKCVSTEPTRSQTPQGGQVRAGPGIHQEWPIQGESRQIRMTGVAEPRFLRVYTRIANDQQPALQLVAKLLRHFQQTQTQTLAM